MFAGDLVAHVTGRTRLVVDLFCVAEEAQFAGEDGAHGIVTRVTPRSRTSEMRGEAMCVARGGAVTRRTIGLGPVVIDVARRTRDDRWPRRQ